MILFLYIFVFYFVNIHCNELNLPNTTPANEAEPRHFNFIRGSSVDEYVGSENVVFCTLLSPRRTYYDDFGRCRLSIDRVGLEHQGYWSMHVAYPGQATFDVDFLHINVTEREPKPQVHTVVEESSPNILTVTCSLPIIGQEVKGCKFRGPNNMMLIAFGTKTKITEMDGIVFESRVEGSECSVRITNPRVSDLGFWRCAMSTEQDTYFGFFTLMSSWHQDATSIVNTIRRGPMLRVDHEDISVYEDEPVTVSCSIDAPIRYCYFWMSDGTIFNVYPGHNSSSMEYVGSGFDAGECGLKIKDLNYKSEDRRWTCNVAPATGSQQSSSFWVSIQERMRVYQRSYGETLMMLSGRTDSELEYCRFVQNGGDGFSHDTGPLDYLFVGSLSEGRCELRINFPRIWTDYSPWTIVAKVKGEDGEISRRTRGLPIPIYNYTSGWAIFGWVLLSVVIAAILISLVAGPQRNRKWISRRATNVRQSLRRQAPPPYTPTS